MKRTAYMRAYYKDTAPRRRYLANFRKALRINCAWLLEEIRAHREPELHYNTAASARVEFEAVMADQQLCISNT